MTDSGKEHQIVCLIKNGDHKASRQLYDTYAGYLTGVCARYVSDDDSLRDVLQETFINIFNSLGKFSYRGTGSLKAWLTKIAVNQSLKFMRDNGGVSLVSLNEIVAEDTLKEASLLDDEVENISERDIINLIRELPPGYRMILNLYVFEDKSHKEIAKLLNIKESTSASQFHRAKALLARKIKEFTKTNKSFRYER